MSNNDNNFFIEDVNASNITPDTVHLSTVYLSDVIDVETYINAPLTDEQRADGGRRIYLIKSPMGSGKTHIIQNLTNHYHQEGKSVGHMMVYKKNIDDIIEGTKTVEYLSVFTDKAIKENIENPRRHGHIQTYTKRFFDVFAEGLIESGLETVPESGYDTANIIDNYFRDKLILVDECDYMINMLAAFTSSFANLYLQDKAWSNKFNLLKEAAKQFYLDISTKCKAMVLFTATTTSEFLELLPPSVMVIDPTDYLDDNQQLKSISIVEVKYVPFYEWDYGSSYGTLTEKIIRDITTRFTWDKILQFSPNIQKRHIEYYLDHFRTGVLAPPNKLNQAAKQLVTPTTDTTTQIFIQNHSLPLQNAIASKNGQKLGVIIHIKDFDTHDDSLVDLHTALNNEFVEEREAILITGSNARAANITTEYDDVLVITDAPWSAEVIQALGRFRNARIHAYILDRHVSDRVYSARRHAINKEDNKQRIRTGENARKQSDMQRRSKSWWKNNSKTVYLYWVDRAYPLEDAARESRRLQSLMAEIEDFNFTLSTSMQPFTFEVDLTYCSPDFELSIEKPLEDKKGGKVLQFLKDYPDLSQRETIAKWKEVHPDDKVISSVTVSKYRKLLKEQG